MSKSDDHAEWLNGVLDQAFEDHLAWEIASREGDDWRGTERQGKVFRAGLDRLSYEDLQNAISLLLREVPEYGRRLDEELGRIDASVSVVRADVPLTVPEEWLP